MTLFTETGTFARISGTGSQEVNLAGSFQPKVLWLWATAVTANATYAEGVSFSYGFSDGTNDACIGSGIEDDANTMRGTGVIRSNAIVHLCDKVDGNGTAIAVADVTSFDADGFTLNWSIGAAAANGVIIHYMAVGGTDITNVFVLNTTTATTSTGNQGYTGVGFAGDFINTLAAMTGMAINTETDNWMASIGAATSSTARWTVGHTSEIGVGTSDTYNFKEITSVISTCLNTTGAVSSLADFVQFDANGFTLNWTDAPAATTDRIAALVIKGGLWNVGNGTAPAAPGTQTINTTSGRDPEGVMMFTWGDTTTSSGATGEAENRLAVGAADNSLNHNCVSINDSDADPQSITSEISLITKIIRAHNAAATATSSTTLAEAGISDMDNDGNFIIDWTTTLNGMGYTWFSVSKTFTAPSAAADEERYMAVNTIPSLYYPRVMDDLLNKITGQRTNTRTVKLLRRLCNSLQDTKFFGHWCEKLLLRDPYFHLALALSPHRHLSATDRIQKTLDKSVPKLPMVDYHLSQHTSPSQIDQRF